MRDCIKTREYFVEKISALYEGIDRFNLWIEKGKTPKERITIVKRAIVWDYISIIGCKYSMGCKPNELKDDLLKAISIVQASWDGYWKVKNAKGEIYNQYVASAYDEMLWLLSLGYLLDIPDENFKILADVIDKDQIKDYLLEFILRAKLGNREPIVEESYKDFMGIPKCFEKLRLAIFEVDKSKAENLILDYINNDWYKNHKDSGWYNSHKSKHDSYFGYWSFEAAAIVKIINLDNLGLKKCKYFPCDL